MNPVIALRQLKNSLEEHGLSEWTASLDNAVRRFGVCDISNKRISLSRKLCDLNSDEEVTDTILHEIAHALAYKRHGVSCGHDNRWKSICEEIGARPEACYDDAVVEPDAPWVLVHKTSGEVFRSYHKKPRRNWSQVWIRGRKQETLGQLTIKSSKSVQQADAGNGATRTVDQENADSSTVASFTQETVLEVQENLVAMVKAYAKQHGMQLTNANCKYNSRKCDFTLSLAIPDSAESANVERIEFEALASLFGLTSNDYQRQFSLNGRSFRLIGFKPNNRKYPIIGVDENDRRYKFSTDVVDQLLTT